MGTHVSSPGGGGGGGGGTDTDPLPSTTTPTTQAFGDPPSEGVDTTHFALADHEHGLPAAPSGGSSGPAVGGTLEIPLKLPVTKVGAWALQPLPPSGPPAWYSPYNSSDAQNDSGTWHFKADAGTYTLDLDAWQSSTSAVHHILIDGVEVAAIDVYFAGGGPITPYSHAGIVIAGSGDHTITLLASTRNAAGTGWFLQPVRIVLTRTA